jgi:Phage portal protein, SPP1 Gp6-like
MTQTMLPPITSAQDQPAQPVYEITEQDKKRQKAIADAWKAYNGELDPPLRKMPDGTDPNVMSNRCQPIVDRGIDFLFGLELEISVEDAAPQKVQKFLDQTWGRKEARLPLLQELGMNGAMAGAAFLRIVPNEDASKFRLVTVDPATVFMQTAPQDCDTVLLFCIQYSQMEKINGQQKQVYYREEIMRVDPDGNARREQPDDDDTWQIQHWTQVTQMNMDPRNEHWTPAGPPIAWPYPFPPIFKCKNLPKPNDPWGTPDLTPDLIQVNKALNMVQSCIQLIEIIYGQPIVWASGVSESSIKLEPGKVTILPPTPESKMGAVPIASDVPNALTFAENLRSDIDEQSSVPGVATGRISTMPRGNLSGIAIELLFMAILKKTDKKRCLYGELTIDVSQALLVLAGLAKRLDEYDIELAWQNPLPHDDLPDAQKAITLLGIGVSKTTLQRENGYDPEEELALSQAEDERAIERQQQMMAAQPQTFGYAQPPQPGQPPQQQGGQPPQKGK